MAICIWIISADNELWKRSFVQGAGCIVDVGCCKRKKRDGNFKWFCFGYVDGDFTRTKYLINYKWCLRCAPRYCKIPFSTWRRVSAGRKYFPPYLVLQIRDDVNVKHLLSWRRTEPVVWRQIWYVKERRKHGQLSEYLAEKVRWN